MRAVLLAFAASASLCWSARKSTSLKFDFFLAGAVFHIASFYWLPATITLFGGFPAPVSYLIFLLFVVTASLQFVLCGWMYGKYRETKLASYGFALPGAWLIAEVVFPRLFPWCLAHPLVGWVYISGLAEYFGVFPLSALLLWWCEALLDFFSGILGARGIRPKCIAAGFLSLVICLVAGRYRLYDVEQMLASAQAVRVGVVQGNLQAKQKGDVRYLEVNLERYRELSRKLETQGAQVLFWPESVLNAWTPGELQNVRNSRYDPYPGNAAPLVYGGLSYRRKAGTDLATILREHPELDPRNAEQLLYQRFNSALAIDETGKMLGRYHKRVLMPFGEYLPFSEALPFMKSISPQTGDFTPGDIDLPIVVQPRPVGPELRVGALICYEDLVPQLAQTLSQQGANVLVNLTNDAWYGDTAAPYQHHLLAQWRAIETRRFFVRATNTGFTAIVDPAGKTLNGLPLFQEGTLIQQIYLLNLKTLYANFADLPVYVLCVALLIVLFRAVLLGSSRKNKGVGNPA